LSQIKNAVAGRAIERSPATLQDRNIPALILAFVGRSPLYGLSFSEYQGGVV
jgi:hypothetical protein